MCESILVHKKLKSKKEILLLIVCVCVYIHYYYIYILLTVVLLLLLLFKRLPLFGLDIFWVPKYSYKLLSLSRDKLFYLLSQKKKKKKYRQIKCSFGTKLKSHFILLFNLFLLLFMGLTALFYIIHKSHCTISANFYFYIQYF